jgi:putative MATE family efflux protein
VSSGESRQESSPSRRLLHLAGPVIGLNVLNVLALAVDTAMVGRLPTPEDALTGIGFGTQFLFILMVFMMGLTVGSVAIVARAYGAGNTERVNEQLCQSMQLTVLLGVAVSIFGHLIVPTYLDVVRAEGGARDAALTYLRPLLTGVVFNYLTILLGSVLRGVRNTRLAFQVAIATNLLNFALNYVLIFGNAGAPALGIQGAAIGTLCSHVLGVTLMLVGIGLGAVPGVRVPRRPVAIDWPGARALLAIGAPAALDMVVLNAGFLSIVGMLGHLDALAVAAHGIGLRIQALAFVPGLSIAQASGALVGNALGARDPAAARRVGRAAISLCAAIMTAIALIILLLRSFLLDLFQVDPEAGIGAHAYTWMAILASCMPLAGIHISLVGVFQGAGDTRAALVINLIGTFLVQIPASYLLGITFGLGPVGVWLGFPLGFIARVIPSIIWYRRGSWESARILPQGPSANQRGNQS